MKKTVFATIVSAVTFLLAVSPTNAAVSCQPIYGGGQTCVQAGPITVDKKVEELGDPGKGGQRFTGRFVDSLGVNNIRYNPDESITFQITVMNTGNAVMQSVTVRDLLPFEASISVQGPGTFDANTRTLTFFLQNLNPGESRTEKISARIVSANQLPANQAIICPINQVTATASDGQVSQDNAQFCIEKQVLGATPVPGKGAPAAVVTPGVTKGGLKVFPSPKAVTTPPTGPEALALAALLPTGALGAFLRKLAGGR